MCFLSQKILPGGVGAQVGRGRRGTRPTSCKPHHKPAEHPPVRAANYPAAACCRPLQACWRAPPNRRIRSTACASPLLAPAPVAAAAAVASVRCWPPACASGATRPSE